MSSLWLLPLGVAVVGAGLLGVLSWRLAEEVGRLRRAIERAPARRPPGRERQPPRPRLDRAPLAATTTTLASMLNFSPEKLLLVALIAMIVLGPSRLPQAARTLGRFMAEMRRMSSSFQDEVRDAIGEPTEAFHSAIADFRPAMNVRSSVRDAISTTLRLPPASGSLPSADPPATPGAPPPLASPGPLAAPDDPALN